MTSPDFTVRQVSWSTEQDALTYIRDQVFVREQKVPPDLEWDRLDETAVHVLARDSAGRPVGVARILPSGQIGRMAVLGFWRGRGVGRALLQQALDAARALGCADVFLNAQTSAEAFYTRYGFRQAGEVFEEAGIPHVRMELHLGPTPS